MHFLLLHDFIISYNKKIMLEIHGTNVKINITIQNCPFGDEWQLCWRVYS